MGRSDTPTSQSQLADNKSTGDISMKGELTKVGRDQDFAAWCEQNAEALARKDFKDVPSPSLRPKLKEAVIWAWPRAIRAAQRETGLSLDAFPLNCPYEIEAQMLNSDWFPAASEQQ
jgi:hypothetical protein